MITGIFSKSKPINFIIVAVLIVTTAVFANYNAFSFQWLVLGAQFIKILFALLFLFVLDFIIAKNNITKQNSYGIMVMGLAFAIFPETLQNTNILIANILLLFAFRRLLSLHTKLDIKQKFFDATFWIGLASLFHTWSLLFLIVVLFTLAYYWQNDIKNYIVAAFGLVTVAILLLSYNIIFYNEYILESNFNFAINLDVTVYNSLQKIGTLTIMITVYLWSLLFYAKNVSTKSKKMIPVHNFVILISLVAVVIVAIASQKNGSEFLFVLAPLAMVVANYIETIQDRWFKETFVYLLVLTPIAALFL